MLKKKLKRAIGENHYSSLIRARHSKALRTACAFAAYPIQKILQAGNDNYFAVNICGSMGYGALLTHLIKVTKYAHIHGKIPHVISISQLYSANLREDCIAPYIRSKKIDRPISRNLHYISVKNEQNLDVFGVPQHMNLVEANMLFNEYYEFQDIIHDTVQNIMRKAEVAEFDLSIHYRCTDKQFEAPTVPLDRFTEYLKTILTEKHRYKNVFIATDSDLFNAKIQDLFHSTKVTSFQLGHVNAGEPRHFSSLPNQDKALEAIVNMILLSKSKLCIRTASYLSAWSKILNPALETITLNRTFGGSTLFPERQICAAETELASGI